MPLEQTPKESKVAFDGDFFLWKIISLAIFQPFGLFDCLFFYGIIFQKHVTWPCFPHFWGNQIPKWPLKIIFHGKFLTQPSRSLLTIAILHLYLGSSIEIFGLGTLSLSLYMYLECVSLFVYDSIFVYESLLSIYILNMNLYLYMNLYLAY